MQILSNGELAHSLLKPIIDRIDHYQDIVTILTGPSLVGDAQGFDDLLSSVRRLVDKRENMLTFTDAISHKAYSLSVDTDVNDIVYMSYSADPNAAEYTPVQPVEAGRIKPDGSSEGKFWFRPADGSQAIKEITDIACDSVDMLSVYTMMHTTLNCIITEGKVNTANIINAIKSKVTGVRGVANTFLNDLTDQLSSSSIAGVIECIKQYLASGSQSIRSDGYYDFTETNVTKDWFSGVIISGITSVVSTLGTVVSALCLPVGMALQGIGALASGITNFLADKTNAAACAKYQESEGWQLGVHVVKQSYSYGTASWNRLSEMINGKGPMHFEFCGFEVHVWSANPQHAETGVTHDDILVEAFPSCKTCIDFSDLQSFADAHFQGEYKPTTLPGGMIGDYETRAFVTSSYTFKDLAEWYVSHAIPIPDEQWKYWSDNNLDGWYARVMVTAAFMLFFLLFADHQAGASCGSGHFHGQQPGYGLDDWDEPASAGLSKLARIVLYPRTFSTDNPDTWRNGRSSPSSYVEHWPENDDYSLNDGSRFWTTWFEALAEAPSMKSQIPPFLLGIQAVDRQAQGSAAEYEHYFIAPFEYPVLVRYPFKLLPPQFDRASMLAGIIFLAATAVVATAVTAIATVKFVKWRSRQQALMQAKTEKAWAAMTDSPTTENANAYRSACMKQNTLGKIFGCSSVSNTNYWGGSDSSDSSAATSSSAIVDATVRAVQTKLGLVDQKVQDLNFDADSINQHLHSVEVKITGVEDNESAQR